MGYKDTEVGRIPIEWEVSQLVDNAEITMGQSPKSEFYNNEGIGIPFMQGRKTFGDKYHEIDTWCTDPKRFAKKDDVLISVRAPVGDVNIAKMDLCIGRGLASLRMKNGNNEFLYYLIKNYSDILISRGTGTVFSSINKAGLETLKLPFPPDEEQKAIAHILSTLDEKIEVNNQINRTLEKIAQTIFKHWFVDFEFPNENGEPYKSSGGEMVESELGMIPKGWQVKTISDMELIVTDYVANGSFKALKENVTLYDEYNYAAFIRNTDFKCNFNSGMKYVDKHSYDFLKKSRLYGGEVIISNVGDVGSVYLCPYFDMPMTLGNNLIMIKDKKNKTWNYFIYRLFKSREGQGMLDSITGGSVQLKFNKTDFRNLKIVVPSEVFINRYMKVFVSIEEYILFNNKQNSKLADFRDTLLPKLMSGEVKVSLDSEGSR